MGWKKSDLVSIGIKVTLDGGLCKVTASDLIDEPQGLDLFNKRIFIAGQIYSSKNSKIVTMRRNQMGKMVPLVLDSKAVQKYRKESETLYKLYAKWFKHLTAEKQKPYCVEFTPVMNTNGNFDFANIIQVVQDLMQDHGWIEDDNIKNLLPFPNRETPYIINKKSPGIWIKVL